MDMRIAICDDEAAELEYLRRIVTHWTKAGALNADIAVFDSAESFLFAYEGRAPFDILLLDIQMKRMDGLSLAKKLRETDARTQIIFITGFSDYMSEGYDVAALHYLMKPVNERKLCEVLDRACAKLAAAARTVLLPLSDGHIRLPACDILYAEVFSHHIELHAAARTLSIKMSMNELERTLGDGFFRCHRSYIVGMRHVRAVTRGAVIMDNGVALPLSRKLYDEANRAFIDYN